MHAQNGVVDQRGAAPAGPRLHTGPRSVVIAVAACGAQCMCLLETRNVSTPLMALRFLPCRLLRLQELHTRNRPLRLSATVCSAVKMSKRQCGGKERSRALANDLCAALAKSTWQAGSKTVQDGSTHNSD